MAYQALYRKYRPTSFSEVVGQKHIVQTLRNAVLKDRIAHAYLFCGPRGTGKTSIAKIFAKMLNCSENNLEPCQKCSNCRMVQEGMHPDIIEIDAASNNGVDEVRNLIDKVKYAPMYGKYKVYIIDEVHMMTAGAFNALLKTIEEPPAHVVFILATTEPHKVISTIISRCQRFDFSSVSEKDIAERLMTVTQEENIQIDDEALRLIAQLAQGGMRDSLSILDQCISYAPEHVTIDAVREIYGVVTKNDIGVVFSHLQKKNSDELIQQLQSIAGDGMDLKRFTADFISLVKNSILLSHSPSTQLISDSEKKFLNTYLCDSDLNFRIYLLDTLMDVYNKFIYASSILDYLEASLLKVMTYSYDLKEYKNNKGSQIPGSEKTISESEKVTLNSYEFPPENSDIYEKRPKIPKNIVNFPVVNISDVSRETFSHSEKVQNYSDFDDEYLLSLLAAGKKKIRSEDEEKLKNLNSYYSDLKFGRFANVIKNTKLCASSESFLLFSAASNMQVKQINEIQNSNGFEEFLQELTGTARKVFAVSDKKFRTLLRLFTKRMKEGTLPSPAVFSSLDPSLHQEESKEETKEEKLLKLFPDLEIIED